MVEKKNGRNTAPTVGQEIPPATKPKAEGSEVSGPKLHGAAAENPALAKLRAMAIPQDFNGYGSGASMQSVFEARQPRPDEWFRVHEDADETLAFYLYASKIKDKGEPYLVVQELSSYFGNVVRKVGFVRCVNSLGDEFIWAMKQAHKGKWNSWHESDYMIAQRAKKEWLRQEPGADSRLAYPPEAGSRLIGTEPKPPSKPLLEMIDLAFAGRIIDTVDHPMIRYIRFGD